MKGRIVALALLAGCHWGGTPPPPPVVRLDAVVLEGTVSDPAVTEVVVSLKGAPEERVSVQDLSFRTGEIPVSGIATITIAADPATMSLTVSSE